MREVRSTNHTKYAEGARLSYLNIFQLNENLDLKLWQKPNINSVFD